ncbi:unnamed protein product, partial [Pleuronectes platessa]
SGIGFLQKEKAGGVGGVGCEEETDLMCRESVSLLHCRPVEGGSPARLPTSNRRRVTGTSVNQLCFHGGDPPGKLLENVWTSLKVCRESRGGGGEQEGSRRGAGGLMGIRQEGKQASKPQQKPQT